MNPKQTILLASMTLALCACPLSGDDVEPKIHHAEDTRLVGPSEPDTLKDLTKELAKRKAAETQKVKENAQKAQAKIFKDAKKNGKPDEIAKALKSFEEADDLRKKMTYTPELKDQYQKLKEQCLADPECKKAYLPDDKDDGKDDNKPGVPPTPPSPPPLKNVPEDKDRTKEPAVVLDQLIKDLEKKYPSTQGLPTDILSNADTFITEWDNFLNNINNINNIDSDLKESLENFNKQIPNKDLIFSNNDDPKHLYVTDNFFFKSGINDSLQFSKLDSIIPRVNMEPASLPKPSKPNQKLAKITYQGPARTWGMKLVTDANNDNVLVPHLLEGTLNYIVTISPELYGEGTITNLPYAGYVSNIQGGMSVAAAGGVFILSKAKLGIDETTLISDKLQTYKATDKTYKANGTVTWVQSNGDLLPPNQTNGTYEIALVQKKNPAQPNPNPTPFPASEFLVGKATVGDDVGKSDIILIGTGIPEFIDE